MFNIHNNFIILILFINLITIIGFIIGKLNYKKENNTSFISILTLTLGTFFIIYTLCLIILSINLFYRGSIIGGLLILFLSFIPFFLGKLSTYKSADVFINLQIIALITNLIIICKIY